MRVYVEQTFGPWDPDWQAAYYRKRYNPVDLQIIQLDGVDIGMWFVQERTEEIYLARIEILPDYQGLGIGTAMVEGLLTLASERDKPVALQVLKVNRRARDLYQRLGFGVTGENDTHYILAFEQKKEGF